MSLLPDLSFMALRPLMSSLLEKAGEVTDAILQQNPSSIVQSAAAFLVARLNDASKKLPEALRRSADRAWRSLEVALAGESWWTRLRDRGEDKAFRQQVRLFLDARALDLCGRDEAFRQRCLDQLRSARKVGLIPGDLGPQAGPELTADFTRFGDPTQAREAEWRVAARMAKRLRGAGHPDLADLLELRPSGQGAPLLAVAVRFFFRCEIETDPTLFQGFLYAQVDQLGESVRAGFERLEEAFAVIGPALEQQGESLEQILDQLSALRGDVQDVKGGVLDLKGEMERQGVGQRDIYREVQRLGEKLEGLHERALRPSDSLSIRGDAERQLVKQVVERYRAMPEEQRRRLPALLESVGRLEMAAGDFPAARADFRQLTHLVSDQRAKAGAHYGAYLAALESRDWDAALLRLNEAMRLDPTCFSPFPDRYEAERILGAGGFGVVFLCRHRHSRARLVVKAIHAEALGRTLDAVFEEAAVLEELKHPAVIRLRDCGYADAGETRPYLVMDFFDGPTLEAHVKERGPLTPDDARAVARRMAEGLQAAHGRNLLHRDVKPGNVLVQPGSDGWQVKLIDFGLAVRQQTVRNTVSNADALAKTVRGRSIAGTREYAAPEQMGQLNAPVGPYSDVYGFGRTLCYAVFATPHPNRRHWRGLRDEALSDLLEACIEEQPAKRPQDFGAVLRQLNSASSESSAPKAAAVTEGLPDLDEEAVLNETDQLRALKGKEGLNETDRLRAFTKEVAAYLTPIARERIGAWRSAAAAGSAVGQYLLGLCLETGAGEGRIAAAEPVEAAQWYRKAADQGFARAQKTLGRMYQTGRGVAKDETVAALWYRKAAEQGVAVAQSNLGVMYANGEGVAKDDAAAVQWYRKAAEQGDAYAQGNLGWMYQSGRGVAKDETVAALWYRKAAEQGVAVAQSNLGVMYESGRGVAKDEAAAARWYRKAAEQGNAVAQKNLGVMYANGRGVTKDDAEAAQWYRKAAEQGFARAEYQLGCMYQQGQGVAKDDAEASSWYRKAAEQGDADAQFCLGVMYRTGRGVAKDEAAAAAWYRKAAEQGDADAQNNLGGLYGEGRGVAKDDAKAAQWYRQAAEQGDAYAQRNLGVMYAHGRGVTKDEAEAVRWYRKAAEQGNAAAQFSLGSMYDGGRGVPKDETIAAQWYRKAAEQGDTLAQLSLGLKYELGQGVVKDEAAAVQWYRKAAEQGDADAQKNLGRMYAHGRGVTKDEAEAVRWYRKAAEQGNAAAQFSLGRMYAHGRGVAQDDAEAARWFQKAAEQGHAAAQFTLGWMYENGRVVSKNDAESASWYRKAAVQGDADAQSRLGWMYANGQGVAKDDAKAVQWYRKGAEQGNAEAQAALGLMYVHGRGVAQDDAKAAQWCRKAAEQGYAAGQGALGFMFETGRGVPQDEAAAVRWYRKAAVQGDAYAEAQLNRIQHERGQAQQDDSDASQQDLQGDELGNQSEWRREDSEELEPETLLRQPLDRRRRRQRTDSEEPEPESRLQQEGEAMLADLVRRSLDRTAGKPTADDNAAASEICRQYRIPRQRAEAIVRDVRKSWRQTFRKT